MVAPRGCSGVQFLPKAGHSCGFNRPCRTSPLWHSVGSSTRHSATPASVNVADARDEACWTPPEEVAMHIQETTKEPEAATAAEKTRLEGSYRPNRQERPVTGAVHAATY